ncbi:Hypothetical predicted protein [Podarcis lilfordi]|uniref:Uncharacterized protein n=1 Tax=Podarcis lilfordi TaxID=74358 RepID=A0AA35JVX0_9SAUR|nr:Hypothetical predicted protein [Podarcis lilfordi]
MNGSPLSECLSLCRNCCLSGAGTLSVKIFNLCILRLFVKALYFLWCELEDMDTFSHSPEHRGSD